MKRLADSAGGAPARRRNPARGAGPDPRGRESSPQAQRTFLVGCPRSGTTFLQAALSKHPDILSLPETAFFERTLPGRVGHLVTGFHRAVAVRGQRGREYLRVQRRARRALRAIARDLGQTIVPGLHLGLSGYVGEFAGMLDAAARANDCSVWLEKTPNHVFYLDVIQRYLPQARFIHLVRRGEDVVASAIEASLRYAGIGDGNVFCESIPWWVACWNAAVAAHREYAGLDNHCVVFYEDLVRDFAGEYARLCDFIGVAPALAREGAVKRVARLEREPWKHAAVSGKLIPAAQKFDALFGPDTQDWIREQLLSYDEVRAELAAADGEPAPGGG